MINKVNKKECLDAISYLCNYGLDGMTSDKKHYVSVLMKKVANTYNIKLEGI